MRLVNVRDLTLIGFFAALTGVCSQIYIPLFFTPIPVNLALLVPLVAGGLLGSKNGVLSQVVYLLVGAVGLPVFAGFNGGVQALVGPTGGYLLGYICVGAVAGLIAPQQEFKLWKSGALMALGIGACYTMGTLWFMISTKTSLPTALSLCVFPFIAGDMLKIGAGLFVVKRLRSPLAQINT